jgi:hypothetical protein
MCAAMLGLAGLLSLTGASFGAVLTTEPEVRQAIVGNTISGIEDGKPYTEYYQPDGYIHGQGPDGPYVGEWRTTGRNFCVRYFEIKENEDGSGSIGAWECMGVEVEGSSFAWIKDGERYKAQLVSGNPNKL